MQACILILYYKYNYAHRYHEQKLQCTSVGHEDLLYKGQSKVQGLIVKSVLFSVSFYLYTVGRIYLMVTWQVLPAQS